MSDEQVRVEDDSPKNLVITVAIIVVTVSVAVMVVGVAQWFNFTLRDEVGAKQLSVEPEAKRELRSMESAHLNKYQWVDKTAGLVRIPVQRAQELVIRDWEQRAAPAPAPADGAAAPAAPQGQ